MDPLGITWGGRDRPAGGWSTRKEGLGAGRGREEIAGQPTDRKAGIGVDRRTPGEVWSQLSEEERDELTRPLRVESGRASPPGVDPLRRRLDRRDLRQEGPRLPELSEEQEEGEGEPRTIERPRVRARLPDKDQGEPARPPGERGGDET